MTHLIFAHPHHDSTDEFAAAMATFCRPGDAVTRVDEAVYAPKGSPDATYLAAFADFDRSAFVQLVQSVPWDFPGSVSAFVRPPGSARFEVLDLELEFDIGRDRKLAVGRGYGFPLGEDQVDFLAHTYPALLDRSREMIRDSLRNPHRYLRSHEVLASVPTNAPWLFECLLIRPESRIRSGRRVKFGPGEEDWRWDNIEHRTVYAQLAVHGVHFGLACDASEVGPATYQQVREAAERIQPGDRVRIVGVVDVLANGECVIERVGRLDQVDTGTDPTEGTGQ
jgi:hypothetical protein